MEFLDSYFEDEVREGFPVSSLMKRAWAAQLQLFDEIRNVCEKHGITYFAEWGTLLGAVRHGGMIPWDDDLDICMKRKDFQRFLSVVKELPEGCWIQDFRVSEDHDDLIAKIVNTRSNFLNEKQLEIYHGFPYHCGIDIFVYDFFPADQKEKEEYISLLQDIVKIVRLLSCREETREQISDEKLEQCLRRLEDLCGITFDRKHSLTQQIYELLETRIAPLYSEQESDELTNIPKFGINPEYRMPKSCFEESFEIPFEMTKIRVPAGYDHLLDHCKYGNYMNPVRADGMHDYPFYKELNEYVLKNSETALLEYVFQKEDLEAHPRCEEKSLKQRAGEYAGLFAETGQSIRQFLLENDYDTVKQLMADCQNLAIQIGTEIENAYGRLTIIEVLEEYCEFLYRIYEKLEKEGKLSATEEIILAWQGYDDKMQSAFREFMQRQEIVFIPYKSDYWHTMQPLWKQAGEEENDVTVIPAPYYYRDCYGGVKRDTMQYEVKNYPENVVLTNYLEYDFKKHQPDVIVIQCPYDEYNYGITMHPFFYAKNLRQYTRKLVYVPALIVDETYGIDEHMREMLRPYCNTPGVFFADEVIVPSDTMKQAYVDILTEFAGEETNSIWQEKITVREEVKDAVPDGQNTQPELPEEWTKKFQKPDGSAKKIVLYTTSVSALYCYGEEALRRIQNVLDEYKEKQEETVLWWFPDRNVRQIMRKRNPAIWRKYCDILQNYKEAAWGILDDSGDAARAVAVCDAAVGDGGVLLHQCRNAGKEITLQKY